MRTYGSCAFVALLYMGVWAFGRVENLILRPLKSGRWLNGEGAAAFNGVICFLPALIKAYVIIPCLQQQQQPQSAEHLRTALWLLSYHEVYH
jgi:hypothetical protein